MRKFTEELKRDLLKRLQDELDKCWKQFGEDPRYRNLDRAFSEGYGIVNGFEYAIDVFREGRLWTAADEEFLSKFDEIWENYRAKYFDARCMRDPFEPVSVKTDREKHRV